MNKGIINKAYLAVFYFRVRGLNYDINDLVSREKARTNFGHTKIDKEILEKAIDEYIKYCVEKLDEMANRID